MSYAARSLIPLPLKSYLWFLVLFLTSSDATAFVAPKYKKAGYRSTSVKNIFGFDPTATAPLSRSFLKLPGPHRKNASRNAAMTTLLARSNNIEVGIQTAQLLMDSKRHGILKKKMKQQFPIVPDVVLDSIIDTIARAFTKVAPEKLRIALQPGGMDQVRPDLERVIVRIVLEHPVIQSILLLDDRDKTLLVQTIVSKAIDYVLRDAQEVLAAPEVRLETLEEQLTEIKALMGPRRLFLYRLRHNYKRFALLLAISMSSIVIYQLRDAPVMVRLLELSRSSASRSSECLSWFIANFTVFSNTVQSKLASVLAFLQKTLQSST